MNAGAGARASAAVVAFAAAAAFNMLWLRPLRRALRSAFGNLFLVSELLLFAAYPFACCFAVVAPISCVRRAPTFASWPKQHFKLTVLRATHSTGNNSNNN